MRFKLTIIRKLVILILLLATKNMVAQQHTLFSHYNFDHFMFNPAAAGNTNALTANFFHRDQWTNFDLAPRTQFLDIHAPMRYQPFAFGGHIYNDNAGMLNNIRFQAASAYQFTVNETGNFSIGLGLNFQRLQLRNERSGISLNPPETVFDPLLDQYKNGVWNFFLTPGIYYNNGKFYGGISSMQILQNDFQLNQVEANTEVSRRHWMLMAGYNYQLNEDWHINPSLLLRAEKAAPLNFDINAVVTYTDLVWLNIGYRGSKMFMIGVGVNLDKMFKAGYNYDMYLNPLGAQKARGSHEIYLGFTNKIESDLDKDGIIDRLDRCPTVKGLAKYNGCPNNEEKNTKPDKKKDTDNDGIPDYKDDCPKVAGSRSNKGCPDIVAKDSDGDGIYDNEDNCPNLPGLKTNNGCPEVIEDTDGDGIVDKEDNCPDVAGVKSNNGCPEIIEKVTKDTDGDGIIDKEDNCPNTFGIKSNNGCPEIIEKVAKDTDGDGIIDEKDKCPKTFGTKSNKGCPEALDSDGDGIDDNKDDCPNTYGIAAKKGCPDVDSDGDGILDLDDGCPNTVGVKANNGCPPSDKDNDGIADSEDDCPDTFGLERNNGCPDAPKPIDTDGDGVADDEDKCPKVYGEDNGCPKPVEIADTDGDGIADNEDDCPNTYGASSNNGCPIAVQSDSDGDGIIDTLDNCPYVYGAASNYGCPSDTSPTNDAYKNILDAATKNLRFGTGSANIEYSSFTTLKDLAKLMINNPGFRLRIAGHTDNVGSAASNMDLSKKRAESVRNYLLNEGVSFGNMIVEYFGGSKPIADNNIQEGRRLNRRVDFELIEY